MLPDSSADANLKASNPAKPRDPEDRPVPHDAKAVREKMLDKTNADSFPSSDPPSTIPDPDVDSFSEDPAAAGPYDRRPYVVDNKEIEGQLMPESGPFDRAARNIPHKDKAA